MSTFGPLPSARQPLDRLPARLLSRARDRVSALALLLLGAFVLQNIESPIWYLLYGRDVAMRYSSHGDLLSAGLAGLLLAVARSRRFGDATALRIGRVLLVLVCLSMGTLTALSGLSGQAHPPMLTWVTLMVALSPLIVPSSPRSTLIFALAAAATSPVGLGLAAWSGAGDASIADYVAVSVNPLLAAVIAVIGARVIHDTTVDLYAVQDQERLLEHVLEQTTTAVVLLDDVDRVSYANDVATRLVRVRAGDRWAPDDLGGLPLGAALADGRDGLYTGIADGRRRTILFGRREVLHQLRPHRLVLVREVTAEQAEHEVGLFRETIRYLTHELANTLAPIRTAMGAIRLLARQPEHLPRLHELLDALNQRVTRLDAFVRDYASLARLPSPRRVPLDWRTFLGTLRGDHPFVLVEPVPAVPALVDPDQLQQLVINLVKNARESGSAPDDVTVRIEAIDGGVRLTVADRGAGMTEEVASRAMLPFFTTKTDGSGLGLALCRDVATGHGGHLALVPRVGGGTEVRLWLPT